MTPLQAAEILARHNRWRRADYPDDSPITMESPRVIGEAMDVAVAYIKAHAAKDGQG